MNSNLVLILCLFGSVLFFGYALPLYVKELGRRFGKGVMKEFNNNLDKQFEILTAQQTINQEGKNE